MKTIQIIILLSIFLGFSSVYAQTTNSETNKSDLENKIEQTDPKIKTASQPTALTAGEETTSVTKKASVSDDTQVNRDPQLKTAGDQPDPSRQAKQSKAAPTTQPKSKSESQLTAGDKDPKKKY